MSLFAHPEILEDIRRGVKLRPTKTLDKSRPRIVADGEDIPQLVLRNYDETFTGVPISENFPSISGCYTERFEVQRQPPPPPCSTSVIRSTAGKKPVNFVKKGDGIVDREKLLQSIKCGVKLRKTVTNDRSGLILDDELLKTKTLLSGPVTPNSLSSLDSQGMSLLGEGGTISSSSGIDSPSYNSEQSTSSPLASSGIVNQCQDQQMPLMKRMGSLWIRCDPENSSYQGTILTSDISPSGDFNSGNSNDNLLVPIVPSSQTQPNKYVPTKVSSAQQENSKPKAEFCFDEEAQIKQRQEEVAKLASSKSAAARIAAFSQFQKSVGTTPESSTIQRPSKKAQEGRFSTLPKNFQTVNGGGLKLAQPSHPETFSTIIQKSAVPMQNKSNAADGNQQFSTRHFQQVKNLNGKVGETLCPKNNIRHERMHSAEPSTVSSSLISPPDQTPMVSVRDTIRKMSQKTVKSNDNGVFLNNRQQQQTLAVESGRAHRGESAPEVHQHPPPFSTVKTANTNMAKRWQESVASTSSTTPKQQSTTMFQPQQQQQRIRSESVVPFEYQHQEQNEQEKDERLNQQPARAQTPSSALFRSRDHASQRQQATTNFVKAFPARIVGSASNGSKFDQIRKSFTNSQSTSNLLKAVEGANSSNWTLNGSNKWVRREEKRSEPPPEFENQHQQSGVWRACSENRQIARPSYIGTAKLIHSPTGDQIAMLRGQLKFSINLNEVGDNDDFIQVIRC